MGKTIEVPNPAFRVPHLPRIELPEGLGRVPTTAVFDRIEATPWHADLTRQCDGQPFGQRVIVQGRVLDSEGNGVAGSLLELWQCNTSGRYRDMADPEDSEVDPNFLGSGRCVTDEHGTYRFVTIRPGSYPGPAGSGIPYRPAHLHVSVVGPDASQRLVTQCYFQGDPLIDDDFVINEAATRQAAARDGLVASYDPDATVNGGPDQALGYRWDIVLGGSDATPMEW